MSDATTEAKTGHWLDYLLLAAPSLSTPLLVWAENIVGVGRPERLLLIGGSVWIVGGLVLAMLRRLGVSRTTSLLVVWVLIYVMMRGGSIPDSYGYLLGGLVVAAGIGVGVFLVSRRPSSRLPLVVGIASALLVAEIGLALYSSAVSMGTDRTLPQSDAIELDLMRTPDILVVIADAYVGIAGQDRFYDVEPDEHRVLVDHGFWLPDVAFSPYASTNAALPAIFDMDYPLEAGPGINSATNRDLYSRIGGDNRLVDALSDNGYEVTMIESGWSGSSCGIAVDICVPSAFLNESVFLALEKTWLGRPVLARWGYAFTAGARQTMAWLSLNAREIFSNANPDLILAHLEIPHPPFFLDADCDLRVEAERGGVTLLMAGVQDDVRRQYYLEQAECVDHFLAGLMTDVGDDTIVVLAGDHGSDMHHQMGTHPSEWSDEAVLERMNVMFGFRGPEGCRPGQPVLLSEVFSSVLSCLSDVDLPRLPPRMFLYAGVEFDGEPSPVLEVPPEEVGSLLSSGG